MLFFRSLSKTVSWCSLLLTWLFDFSSLDQVWDPNCTYCAMTPPTHTPPWHALTSQSRVCNRQWSWHFTAVRAEYCSSCCYYSPTWALQTPAFLLFFQLNRCSSYTCLLHGLFWKMLKKLYYSQVWYFSTLSLLKLAFCILHVSKYNCNLYLMQMFSPFLA